MSERGDRPRRIDVPLLFAAIAIVVVVFAILATNLPPCHEPAQNCAYQRAYEGIWEAVFSAGFWTAAFTGALTASTIFLWYETRRLASGAESQADDNRDAIQSAKDAAIAAAEANKLTREIYAATERPWVYVKSARIVKAHKTPDGRWHFHLLFTVKNGGRAPAIRAWVHSFQHFKDTPVKDQILQRAAEVWNDKWHIGLVLFPGDEDDTIPAMCDVPPEQSSNGMHVIGAGFVSYQFITDNTHHFTSFSFSVIGKTGAIITPDPDAIAIPVRELGVQVRADGTAN